MEFFRGDLRGRRLQRYEREIFTLAVVSWKVWTIDYDIDGQEDTQQVAASTNRRLVTHSYVVSLLSVESCKAWTIECEVSRQENTSQVAINLRKIPEKRDI